MYRSLTALASPSGLLSTQPPILGWQTIQADVQIVFERDVNVSHWFEILCFYPGVQALLSHRLAHWLYIHQVALLPRLISHLSRFFTGIQIHPGARIGQGVFISGGMGVVIGETAIVGDYALIYQDVTLGGTGKDTGKRHPTLGKHTIVGVGAKVLGNIYIGDYAEITAGAIVLRDVPPGCTVVGIPGRNICHQRANCQRDRVSLFDPDSPVVRSLFDRLNSLETQIKNSTKSQKKEFNSINNYVNPTIRIS